jgi:hypothetical protein
LHRGWRLGDGGVMGSVDIAQAVGVCRSYSKNSTKSRGAIRQIYQSIRARSIECYCRLRTQPLQRSDTEKEKNLISSSQSCAVRNGIGVAAAALNTIQCNFQLAYWLKIPESSPPLSATARLGAAHRISASRNSNSPILS